ncbi:MAG TPA: hypothetical protein VMB70_05890, partial [Terriglobia bacterium]|nr:hypothetical protein [Terriglobia bacterium]
DGCNDVCINGRCPPTYPAKGIRLLFNQFDKTVELSKIDADRDFRFSLKTNLPRDAVSGPATIVAETLYGRHTIRTSPILFTVAGTR